MHENIYKFNCTRTVFWDIPVIYSKITNITKSLVLWIFCSWYMVIWSINDSHIVHWRFPGGTSAPSHSPTHQSGLGPIMESKENRCLLVSTWNLAVMVPSRLSSPHRGGVFSTVLMFLLCREKNRNSINFIKKNQNSSKNFILISLWFLSA